MTDSLCPSLTVVGGSCGARCSRARRSGAVSGATPWLCDLRPAHPQTLIQKMEKFSKMLLPIFCCLLSIFPVNITFSARPSQTLPKVSPYPPKLYLYPIAFYSAFHWFIQSAMSPPLECKPMRAGISVYFVHCYILNAGKSLAQSRHSKYMLN